ncbi:cytochrome P450 4V2 [Caerostris extrusa]|uniref:Cytochrome P450 4V2 n=1 Tax=Caerostris extrusa TaxID=172846 RepID=A0AAV4QJH0_CAEEX|nr:cytochrome P450 4V2 [Caerostris extrusa]
MFFRSRYLCVHRNRRLAILGLWRKKYSQFVPDNKHSVFKVLVDVMDSILFVTSLKKNALHVYVLKYFTEKSKKSRQYPLFKHWLCGVPLVIIHKTEAVKNGGSQWKAQRKLLSAGFQSSMLKGYVTVFNEHAQKLVEILHEETGKDFTCVESLLSLCSLDIVCESILGVKIGAMQKKKPRNMFHLFISY